MAYNSSTYRCYSDEVINPGIAFGFDVPTHPFMLTLRARVKNNCGKWSNWTPGFYFQIKGCPYYPFSFTLSPNPASSTVTITTAVPDKQYAKVKRHTNHIAIQSVKIYTSSGRLVKKQKFSRNSSQVQIDISALIPGIYFVEMNDGTNKAVQKLVIENKSKAIGK